MGFARNRAITLHGINSIAQSVAFQLDDTFSPLLCYNKCYSEDDLNIEDK